MSTAESLPILDELGDRLTRAMFDAERREIRVHRWRGRWSRRTWVLSFAALLLVAVPAVAAVTGALSIGGHHPRSQPQMVDIGPVCHGKTAAPRTTTNPPAPELTRILAVLRRPQTPNDRLPNVARAGALVNGAVNPDNVRLAQRTSWGASIYLIPVDDINAGLRMQPSGPGCRKYPGPKLPVVPGLIVYERMPNHSGGAGHATADAILAGMTLNTSYTEGVNAPGHAIAYGMAPDGVDYVVMRYRRNHRWHAIRVPVLDNTFAAGFPGHAGQALRLFFHTAAGLKAVGRQPPSRATRRRQFALLRKEKARDRAATRAPSVFPEAGTPRSIFTFRMRVAQLPTRRSVYVVAVKGPKPGECARQQSTENGMLPAETGALRGLIKTALGAGPRGRWCRGAYSGQVLLDKNGRRSGGRTQVTTFTFSVR
jgi:hypothetical protein